MAVTTFKYASQSDLKNYFNNFGDYDQKTQIFNWVFDSGSFGAIGTDAPPIQAFVVESDVSNAQALQSELDLQGTL